MAHDTFVAPLEIKFADTASPGEFEGYASVFGIQDSHGDLIKAGAFADTLAERKAAGRSLPMHVMHGVLGGDGVPVGVWKSVAEDEKGLYVQGKISGATNTDAGKLLHERVKDGALPGLSIGYRLKPNGAVYGKQAGEPKRTLKALSLHEISLVGDPSNPHSVVTSVKSAVAEADSDKAAASLAAAMRLHDKSMGESYSYGSPKDKALLMDHLRDAHHALTGSRSPDGLDGWTKSIDRQAFADGIKSAFGLPESEIDAMWARLVAAPSNAGGDPSPVDLKSALGEVGSMLKGFSLPTFG